MEDPAKEAAPRSRPAAMVPAAMVPAATVPAATVPAATVPAAMSRRNGRFPIVFAVSGLVLALAAGGLYYYRERTAAPPRSAEQTVEEFLRAVFVAHSPEEVSRVVCQGWPPSEAIVQTARAAGPYVDVAWDDVRPVTRDPDRVTVLARLRLRPPLAPWRLTYRQWRFHLVDEHGWRVCEARPLVV